jgi:hypothetical protein
MEMKHLMTVEQTVEIPEYSPGSPIVLQLVKDRQAFAEFRFPRDFPSGKAKIAFTIDPEQPAETNVLSMCLNRSTFESVPQKPLKPLRGIGKGSSFTVEQLLKDRRNEDNHS